MQKFNLGLPQRLNSYSDLLPDYDDPRQSFGPATLGERKSVVRKGSSTMRNNQPQVNNIGTPGDLTESSGSEQGVSDSDSEQPSSVSQSGDGRERNVSEYEVK